MDEWDAALTQKIAQMKRPPPKRERVTGGREQPVADAGGGGKPKGVGGREGMAIKLLKRDLSEMPFIYKGTGKDPMPRVTKHEVTSLLSMCLWL